MDKGVSGGMSEGDKGGGENSLSICIAVLLISVIILFYH